MVGIAQTSVNVPGSRVTITVIAAPDSPGPQLPSFDQGALAAGLAARLRTRLLAECAVDPQERHVRSARLLLDAGDEEGAFVELVRARAFGDLPPHLEELAADAEVDFRGRGWITTHPWAAAGDIS